MSSRQRPARNGIVVPVPGADPTGEPAVFELDEILRIVRARTRYLWIVSCAIVIVAASTVFALTTARENTAGVQAVSAAVAALQRQNDLTQQLALATAKANAPVSRAFIAEINYICTRLALVDPAPPPNICAVKLPPGS